MSSLTEYLIERRNIGISSVQCNKCIVNKYKCSIYTGIYINVGVKCLRYTGTATFLLKKGYMWIEPYTIIVWDIILSFEIMKLKLKGILCLMSVK